MSAKYQNATKQYLLATRECTVSEFLEEELGSDGLTALSAGGVWLERKRVTDPNRQLQPTDTLRVYLSPIQHMQFELLPEHIVLEDDHLLVINKPAAVSACADRACITYNVTYGVAQYYNRQGNPYKPVPINRLDFMVRGLMIFAKSKDAELVLFKLSLARKIHKYYHAKLDPIDNPPKYIRIKDKLTFTNKCHNDENGKTSESLFIYRGRETHSDVYGVMLLTGRRHQIRFHAAHYLSPIQNDSLYGPNKNAEGPIELTAVALNFYVFEKRYRIRLF